MTKPSIALLALGLILTAGSATWPIQAAAESAEPMVISVKRLSLETALRMAKAALEQCRKEGVQVAVTVVDRSGQPQVVLRDVLAMSLTLTISQKKAYTALSFNQPTSALAGTFKQPFSIAKLDELVMTAGGVPIQAGGTLLGGIGVAGAPSGETDESCAKAGVEAVMTDLEMSMM